MQKDISSQIGRSTKWSGITEITAKLISPIVNMVLARLLTPGAFGVVATITMVISFAEIFTDAGFQKYIIQHEYQSDEELDKSTNVAFWTNLGVSILICCLIFFFRDFIAELVGSPGLGNSISIASLLIIVAAFSSIQMARYKRAFDFKTLFYARIGTALIPLLVTVPLAFALRSYWALLIGTFISQLFNAIVLTVKSKWKPSFYFNWTLLCEMFSFSAWTLLESLSIWLTSYIGVFIIGHRLNEYYLGIYQTSISTVGTYMSLVTGAVAPVLFSALSRYQDDEKEFKKTYYRLQRVVAILIFPMGIGIYLFRDLVTYVLLGSQWAEASGFIGLWGLTSAFAFVFSHFSSEVFRSKGNPKVSLLLQILHLIFLVPTLLIAVEYDFKTLYTARSLIRIQMIITAMIFMHTMYKISILKTIQNVLPMIISSLVMGLIGYLLQQISASLLWQFASILICVVVYFAVLLVISPSLRKDLLETKFIKKLKKSVTSDTNMRESKETKTCSRDTFIERQAELSNCNFVKTILMLLIVIYHSMIFWTGTWFSEAPKITAKGLAVVSQWMNTFHIYAFTLVSGYLFFFLKHENDRYNKFGPFLLNKAKRLLIPYVFVALVWVIPFALYFFEYSSFEIVERFALGTSPNQLWFLLMLFGVFAIFYPLSNFFKDNDIKGIIVLILIYGVGIVGASKLPNIFQIFRACMYLPFFWLGFKIRQKGSTIIRKIPALVWLAVDIVLFLLVEYLGKYDGFIYTILLLGFEFVLHIVGAVMAFVILQKIAGRVKWKENKYFAFLGKLSMPIYLFHQQVIYLFVYWLNGLVNPYLHAAINFLGAMIISCLLSWLLMKFKWTRKAIGEK